MNFWRPIATATALLATMGCLAACAHFRHHDATNARLSEPAQQLAAALKMVTIPGGTFQMGDLSGQGKPNELPVHTVAVRTFRLGKYEVTVEQFRRFVVATDYRTEAERNIVALLPWALEGCGIIDPSTAKLVYRKGLQWDSPGFHQQDSDPVVCVSWNDAQQFIRWLNRNTGRHFRLPSEAEWEYAARAHTTTVYYWGDDPEHACAFANIADDTPPPGGGNRSWPVRVHCSDGYFYTSPVGHYAPNAFGVFDILGNVREWTEDCAHDSYSGAPSDGSPWLSGDCARRMARGNSLQGDPRVSERGHGTVTSRDFDFGFRLAEDAAPRS